LLPRFAHKALELDRLRRELIVIRLQQEGIETTAMIDRPQRISGDAQLD
jgi:hypothetical protein